MSAFYNEIDPFAAEWLRGLIKEGLIAPGVVDERSITELQPRDLGGFTQCHFFAGIGGWSYALRLAGWPDDRPVWTGSCPCQPYSSAGKRKGEADARDLWPEFLRLIAACRPGVVFGEQVASADVVGKAGRKPGEPVRRVWLDRVHADLAGAGYAFGACVLGAHSVGAPHIRQRLYWVADATGVASERRARSVPGAEAEGDRERGDDGRVPVGPEHGRADGGGGNAADGVALGDANGAGPQERVGDRRVRRRAGRTPEGQAPELRSDASSLGHTADRRTPTEVGAQGEERRGPAEPGVPGGTRGLDDPDRERHHGQGVHAGPGRPGEAAVPQRAGEIGGTFWSAFDLVHCRDGKSRRVEPGTFPLAHGVSGRVAVVRPGVQPEAAVQEDVRWVNRVGTLRGFGNAIISEDAAAFVRAAEAVRNTLPLPEQRAA